jgi:hypothetical protein
MQSFALYKGVKMISFKLSHLVKVLLIMVMADLIRIYFSPDYTQAHRALEWGHMGVFFLKMLVLAGGIKVFQMIEKDGGAK